MKSKADRRRELSELMASGAKVTVVPSVQRKPTKQEEEAYAAGWFDGLGRSRGVSGDDAYSAGTRAGMRHGLRREAGSERYSGPQWEETLRRIQARAAAAA